MLRTITKAVLIGMVAALTAGLVGCDETALTSLDPTGAFKSDTYKWRFTLAVVDDDKSMPQQATGRIPIVPWQ
ncbi:MAG: hypothetical protein JXO22_15745 [Phycisphaerae bacterium]|nr:hypothetical protein [Phycisphaerae bacterium]